MTKEPKLTMASRIIPEWTSYDNEIRELLSSSLPPIENEKETQKDQKDQNYKQDL